MKKVIYTVALLLATGTFVQAQTPVKQSGTELADFMLLENDLMVYTKKEAQGQFIYTEKRNEPGTAQKQAVLNAGTINAVIGKNRQSDEFYVYQKNGRNEEMISFYTFKDGNFEKTGERKLPTLKNHSYNLGLFLSEDKNTLLISAELGKSEGYDDLYLSKWESDKWTKPKNLGKTVNTRDVEFAPFMADDSLYFSRKQQGVTNIYGLNFSANAGEAGNPVKLATAVNQAKTYNAYFKKLDEKVTWIATSTENGALYTAYVLEKPEPEEVYEVAVEEAVAEMEVTVAEPVVKKKADEPSLVLLNGFNSVRLSLEGISALARFLRDQPEGTALVVKGYSDGFGSAEAKDYVSRNRAVSVQQYINKYFGNKKFIITLENEVKVEKGKAHRKTEVFLMK